MNVRAELGRLDHADRGVLQHVVYLPGVRPCEYTVRKCGGVAEYVPALPFPLTSLPLLDLVWPAGRGGALPLTLGLADFVVDVDDLAFLPGVTAPFLLLTVS